MVAVNRSGFVTAEQALRHALLLAIDASDETDVAPRLDRLDLLRMAEVWTNLAVALARTGPLQVGDPSHGGCSSAEV